MSKNKTMEDYYRELEELSKDNPEIGTQVELILLSLIELVQQGTQRNLTIINTLSETLGIVMDVMQEHKHCPFCGKIYTTELLCECPMNKGK